MASKRLFEEDIPRVDCRFANAEGNSNTVPLLCIFRCLRYRFVRASKRSRLMTLFQAAMKAWTKFSLASAAAQTSDGWPILSEFYPERVGYHLR